MRAPIPELSVVLPCYRAAPLAERSVAALVPVLCAMGVEWEILVVDDGGADFGVRHWDDPRIRLITHEVNRGKGAAVRSGMTSARGVVRIFTDVDLPFGVDLFPVIHEYLVKREFHVVIGDRSLPGSSYHDEISASRRAASALFTSFVGRIVTGGFFDTQCGLKGVRGDVADALFPLLQVDRFAFDVELLYVALKHRLDIKRIPVQLLHNETSSVRLARDAARGAVDVFRIKANQLKGRYDSPELEAIVRRDFERVNVASRSAHTGS